MWGKRALLNSYVSHQIFDSSMSELVGVFVKGECVLANVLVTSRVFGALKAHVPNVLIV